MLTCDVNIQDSLTVSQDVAIAIGIKACDVFADGCASVPVQEMMGVILTASLYAPEKHGESPAFQNYTCFLPGEWPKGPTSLSVAHFALEGVSLGRVRDH